MLSISFFSTQLFRNSALRGGLTWLRGEVVRAWYGRGSVAGRGARGAEIAHLRWGDRRVGAGLADRGAGRGSGRASKDEGAARKPEGGSVGTGSSLQPIVV